MQNCAYLFGWGQICSLFASTFWSLSPTKLPNIEDFFQETNVQIADKCYTFPYWLSNKQAGNKKDFNINPSLKLLLFWANHIRNAAIKLQKSKSLLGMQNKQQYIIPDICNYL